MKIYTCKAFTGFYPVGVAAIVVAPNQEIAVALLNDRLKAHGLKGDAKKEDVVPLVNKTRGVRILNDGNY